MRILVVNHTASVSGAEIALLRLLQGLGVNHELVVACPGEGPLPNALDGAGIARAVIPAAEVSFRPHPVNTPTGIARLGVGGYMVARSARRFGADVVYANTTRAGLMGILSQRFGGPPLVVRVHDHLPTTVAGRAVRTLIARRARAVLAVSDYTADRFNEGLSPPAATRVYNSIDHLRFDPASVAAAPLRDQLRIGGDAVLLGQVAQITEWKGQDIAIRTLGELRRRTVDAHLVLIGDIVFEGKWVRYDNRAYLNSLHRLVDELRVREAVHFLGHRDDVPALFKALDLSLLPSREEPFALAAVESMAMGTPAFVADGGGVAEVVEDGGAGRVLPIDRPQEWADAILAVLSDRRTLERMSIRARGVAAGFCDDAQAGEIAAHLERAAGERPRDRHRRRLAPHHHETSGARWPN